MSQLDCVSCGRGLLSDGRCYACTPLGSIESDGKFYLRRMERRIEALEDVARAAREAAPLLREFMGFGPTTWLEAALADLDKNFS